MNNQERVEEYLNNTFEAEHTSMRRLAEYKNCIEFGYQLAQQETKTLRDTLEEIVKFLHDDNMNADNISAKCINKIATEALNKKS